MSVYANVIPGISHEQLDKTFQYLVPEALRDRVVQGSVVNVPFGGGNRFITGFVTELTTVPEIDPSRIKPIYDVISDTELPESRMIKVAAWMKEEYGSTMSQALKTVLPVKEKIAKKTKRIIRLSDDMQMVDGYLERMEKRNAKARVRLIKALKDSNSLDLSEIRSNLKINSKTISDLSEAGIITVISEYEYRDPKVAMAESEDEPECLSTEQSDVLQELKNEYALHSKRTVLLHGVTGSGKTFVFTQLVSDIVEQGKQAIVLIPEIALTWQTVRRFRNRFGDRVSILNSRMSKGERYDQFLKAARGEIDVIIGPRSALFTPFEKIGIIIIDEEHESSYKSESVPSYHARETAEFIAGMHGALLVLGSATPSVTSYYRAMTGQYRLLKLSERAAGAQLPAVHVDDMRKELSVGNRGVFSRRLLAAIDDRLKKKEQVMLFINKRGFAGFISCRSCGHVFKCPHCDVSLTYHKGDKLVCHYCGHEEDMVKTCPKCSSKYIAGFRAGTQKIEELVRETFPGANVIRMDKDTTSGKEGHERVLETFASGKADILIGTQMIVKGHDFPRVTLVGALAADMSLFAGDYRAAESTFGLLVQAAGRAGRGSVPGEMIIQTYAPDNYAVVHAASQDYEGFYEEEIGFRKIMDYPPVAFMLKLSLSGRNEAALNAAVEALKERFFHGSLADMGVNVIGPAKEPIYRISDEFRMAVYLKSGDKTILDEIRRTIEEFMRGNSVFRSVYTRWDRE